MGSAGTAPKEGEAPKKPTGGENAEEKTRDALDHAASIVSIAALIATGFGVWSANSLTEKVLTGLIVVSLSGAIIAGIGAWRDLRRFIFTAIFFVACSAFSMALVAVEVGAASPQPASALNSSQSTQATVASGASTAASSSSSPGTNSPAATADPSNSAPSDANPGGYVLEFSKNFTIQENGCVDGNNVPYVRFSRQGPVVTNTNDIPTGTFPQAPWDFDVDCGSEINFNGLSAALTQTPSPEACENQINSGPDQANYFFSDLRDGMQFCLHGISGNLIYLKLTFVSDATYTTTWSATAWTVPSGN